MKLALVLFPVLTIILGKIYVEIINESYSRVDAGFHVASIDTSNFDQEEALEELRKKIKGREQEPAALVFENIKSFKRTPAERLLRIMEMGFSKSLGVNCTHCHNPEDWSSEDKNQKQIARDMMAMVGRINNDLLGSIENLESKNPIVNCTTCHRGQIKPALNLER